MLDSTKLKKTFSLRRRNQRCETEVPDKLFKTVDRHYKTELKTLRERFEKVSVYINDVFHALAKYDVRFQFDPLSLDDCRCDVVSESEINLICELKQLPECCYEVQGNGVHGGVKIRLNEDYRTSNDSVSWDDICSRSRSCVEKDLNTRALVDVFTASLGRALSDVWNEHRNVGLVYRVSGNLVIIYVDIPAQGLFTITLLPALRLNKTRVEGLGPRMQDFFQPFCFEKDFFLDVYAVAKPNDSINDELWQLTFSNVENRLLHSEKFPCGKHCLYALRHLMNTLVPSSPRDHTVKVSAYQLQLVIIKEYATLQNSKAWTPAKFQKRLMGILTSLKLYLKEGVCENPFTTKNIFENFDEKLLKVLNKDVEHVTKAHESLLRNW